MWIVEHLSLTLFFVFQTLEKSGFLKDLWGGEPPGSGR
jgi:hypothetical protein